MNTRKVVTLAIATAMALVVLVCSSAQSQDKHKARRDFRKQEKALHNKHKQKGANRTTQRQHNVGTLLFVLGYALTSQFVPPKK
jgi:hypothetical protein